MTRATHELPPSERMRAVSDARDWAARSDGRERVVLIEPDAAEAAALTTALAHRDVPAMSFTNPWRALAHIGREAAAVVVASSRLGPTPLREIVEAIKNETSLPVLIAYLPEATDAIGPAVLAGGRPLVELPYDAHQLIQAVSAALPGLPPPACVEFGRLSVVPEWHDAHLDGTGLDLSPLEFRVLAELVRRGGRATSREAIVAAAWSERPTEPHGLLTAAVKRIRQKFEALGIPEAVETVRGIGYRLNAAALGEGRLAPVAHPRAAPISAISTSTRAEISSTIRRTS